MAKYVTTESGRVATATVLPLRSFVFTCCGRDCVLAATCNLIGQRRRRLSQRQLVKCNDLDLPARQMGVRTANCQSAACTGAGVGQLATGNNLIKQVAAPKSLRSPLYSLSLSLPLFRSQALREARAMQLFKCLLINRNRLGLRLR